MSEYTPPFFSLPAELRHQIYEYIFEPAHDSVLPATSPFPISSAAQSDTKSNGSSNNLPILLTCRVFYQEASALAFSTTTFRLSSPCPVSLSTRLSILPSSLVRSLRHLTITAKTSALRTLNETWTIYPFASDALRLDTLTILPRRPITYDAYREVADLSQCHTLALVLAQCLVQLENLQHFRLVNNGCFEGGLCGLWGLFCRSTLSRMKRERARLGITERQWRWDAGDEMLEFMRVGGNRDKKGVAGKSRIDAWGWDEDFF